MSHAVNTLRNSVKISIILFLTVSFLFATDTTNTDGHDVELRIDFSSGSVIANETPIVISPVSNHSIVLGTIDTVVCIMTSIFDDPENGSLLSYSAESLDENIISVQLNPADSSLSLNTMGMEGRTDIILTANDGSKEISDTFSVVVKELFVLPSALLDTVVKSGEEPVVIVKDISSIIPIIPIDSDLAYSFTVNSSDEALIRVSPDVTTNTITMEIVDSSFGIADIEVSIMDNDLFIVSDTFMVTVNKSYGIRDYTRERVQFNPGASLFSGLDHSGLSLKLWINDMLGVALNGYFQWDINGLGTDLQVMYKPSLNFVLQPYVMVSGGYHRQTVTEYFDDLSVTADTDVPLFVAKVGGGVDAWVGTTKRNVIGVEVGYRYGQNDYSTLAISEFGVNSPEKDVQEFQISSLHFKVSYSFYFQRL